MFLFAIFISFVKNNSSLTKLRFCSNTTIAIDVEIWRYHVKFLFSLSHNRSTSISWTIKLFFIFFEDANMAWTIMRSYISYFRCLPFLAKGALVDSTLHFMIVLKIFLILIDAVLNILSINWICWGKIFSNGLKFDWSVWKYQSVSIDIVTNFKFFLFWHVDDL